MLPLDAKIDHCRKRALFRLYIQRLNVWHAGMVGMFCVATSSSVCVVTQLGTSPDGAASADGASLQNEMKQHVSKFDIF